MPQPTCPLLTILDYFLQNLLEMESREKFVIDDGAPGSGSHENEQRMPKGVELLAALYHHARACLRANHGLQLLELPSMFARIGVTWKYCHDDGPTSGGSRLTLTATFEGTGNGPGLPRSGAIAALRDRALLSQRPPSPILNHPRLFSLQCARNNVM